MAQIIHDVSFPNDGNGDELREAFVNQNTMNTELYTDKVDKVTGKGLSTNDYTDLDETKLAGIQAGAEVNVQPDWNQNDNSQDDYIKNKPVDGSIVTYGTYSLVGQNLTINPGWVWRINNTLYTNIASIIINFPYAASGYQRIDLVVFNTSSTAVRVAGVEVLLANPVTAPPLISNTVLLSTSLITSSTVGGPSVPAPTGDMFLGAIQTNTALKTFLDLTAGFRNIANTFSVFIQSSVTADRILTAQNKSYTIADNADVLLKQDITNQIEVGTSQNAQASWHGATIIFTASCTITIPASLVTGYIFNGVTLAGVTVSWAITAPKTWLFGTPAPVIEKKIFTLTQRGSTNSIMLLPV